MVIFQPSPYNYGTIEYDFKILYLNRIIELRSSICNKSGGRSNKLRNLPWESVSKFRIVPRGTVPPAKYIVNMR